MAEPASRRENPPLRVVTDAEAQNVAPAQIAMRGLSKRFGSGEGEVVAVENFSLDVSRGQFVALLGPSGCGKSTVLNMAASLIRPSEGEVRLDGEPVRADVPNPKVGYVFQRDTLFPWRTVKANIGYGLAIRGVSRAEREVAVTKAVAAAGLIGFENHFPIALSGGMRQRVSLLRTLVLKPDILLMDEPFGALDAHTKLDMHGVLLELWEASRPTVLFVTHDLAEALTLADRIVLMSARPGRLKATYDVSFPRPRDAVALRETTEYAGLFQKIWHALGEEFRRHGADT